MRIAAVCETAAGERRVAIVPESVKKLRAAGLAVSIQRGAGSLAHYSDASYQAAGADLVDRPEDAVAAADMVVALGAPAPGLLSALRTGQMLLTSLMPARNLAAATALAQRGVTCFSTDAIPRIARAQSMDTLSSMASISGYKGVLLGAAALARYTPMFTTAAGTILASKYFIIGAGVAGLQAIATAKRLGGNVFATDVRPEVKEQIESVGARYIGVEIKHGAAAGGGYARELAEEDVLRQKAMLAEQCALSDVVITTALIGGVTAPRLVDAGIVAKMKPGAVVVDLAAEGGGNCELSSPGETVVHNDVTILAPLNLPSTVASDASLLWSRNLTSFIMAFWKDKQFNLDLGDEILRGATITHQGRIVHDKTRAMSEQADKGV